MSKKIAKDLSDDTFSLVKEDLIIERLYKKYIIFSKSKRISVSPLLTKKEAKNFILSI